MYIPSYRFDLTETNIYISITSTKHIIGLNIFNRNFYPISSIFYWSTFFLNHGIIKINSFNFQINLLWIYSFLRSLTNKSVFIIRAFWFFNRVMTGLIFMTFDWFKTCCSQSHDTIIYPVVTRLLNQNVPIIVSYLQSLHGLN